MKNYWLDEIQANAIAEFISVALGKKFVGTKIDQDEWGKFSLNIMKDAKPRVRDTLMWKYFFKFELNEKDEVMSLEYVRLPWLI